MKSNKWFYRYVIVLGLVHSFCSADLIIDLSTENLPYGILTTWSNDGLLGGSFTSESNPVVEDVDGRKAVTFDGSDYFVSTFTVPDEITGNNSYTVAVWAYNPSIASEECMVNWAKRWTTSRAAQLNYGTSTSYGAVTHWGGADMGFDGGVPAQGTWHHIAVTYQGGPGSLETVYVDGERNAIEYKTLDLWPDGLFYLGCSIEGDETTRVLFFSGSLSQVQVYDTQLTEEEIAGLSKGLIITETDGDTTVSESGINDTYQIVLGMQPSSSVNVLISNDGRVQTNVPSTTFTTSNWATPQTVTVSAVDNQVIEGAMISVLTHTASSTDPAFDELSVELLVTVLDNDRLGDLSNDGTINLPDLVVIAQEWLNDCLIDDFCSGTDLTGLIGQTANPGKVDMQDISVFSELWQQGPILITEFMASNGNNFMTMMNGLEEDPDWIELYNAGPDDIDLNGWYLTDDMDILNKWQFPSVVLGAGRYLVIFASGQETDNYVDDLGYLHTNFSLSTDGEDLAITQPDGMTVSHYWQNYPEQITNYSYGFEMQTLKSGYFDISTPAVTNGTAYDGFVADTKFTRDRGFYTAAFEVEISCDTPESVIRYTTDGSKPTETNGTEYTAPIAVSATTCLRARAFKTGLIPTNTDTQTYLFLEDFWEQERPSGYPTATYDSSYQLDYDIDQDVIGPDNLFDDVYRDTYISDLQALPSMSLVMNVDDLFGIENGIYANSIQEGELWERAASVEMIDPTEGDRFQVDCAIRIQGGYSRNAFETPKHNFRFIFSRPYGPPKLKYKLFPDSDVDEFDQLIVRNPCHDSWLTVQSPLTAYWYPPFRDEGLYASDGWHREIQRQMGHASVHGRWVHLYLNGLYWGIYEVVERPNASFAASYHGGEKEEYDCIANETLRDGTIDAWNTMNTIAASGGTYGSISNPQAYAQIQEYLDVTNLCDYIILNIYSAISDWPGWNYYACRKREPGAHFRFYCWDSEACLLSERLYYNKLNEFNTGIGGAGTLYSYLIANEDFCLLFADRLHKHLHNDGVLSPINAAAAYQGQLDRVSDGLGPESARWGDAWESIPLPTLTKADWLSVQQWLFDTFFPQRGEIVIDIFRDQGIYPDTNPPSFSQYTGYSSAGDTLTMTNPNGTGTIYYTLDGSDPKGSGIMYSGPITLSKSVNVKARILKSSEWSALTETVIAVGPVTQSLRITELMYHPADPNTEFIELQNTGTESINLNLVQFTRGIEHTFGDVTVDPNGYVLLVRNQSAFESYYTSLPTGAQVIQWNAGALDNDEDKVQINDAIGQTILLFTYKDGWYELTDGMGFSLTIRDPLQDTLLWDEKEGWRTSLYAGGSPGDADIALPADSIVVNEVLAHSHSTDPDWIELYNTTSQEIDISGWFLSDNNSDDPNLMKYQIPNGITIQAYSYNVFVEDVTFGNPTAPGVNEAFGLSEAGETVYLTSGEIGVGITGYYQTQEDFDASETNVTFGRYEKAELSGGYDFTRMISATQGYVNSGPLIPDVVITEIHYNPAEGIDHEFVELYNRTDSSVTLMSSANTYTSPTTYITESISWRLEGTGYEFPENVTIPAYSYIVVAKEPTVYSSLSCDVYGPYDGKLDNGGEQIEIQIPGDQEYGQSRSWIPIEKIDYDDASPWPTTPDGSGDSLQRININMYGRDYSNWQADSPNPGS